MRAHWHLKSSLPPASRVVDLGCGSAHACRNLADRQINYTGVDWSSDQITLNQKQMPAHNFLASSLYKVPLADESFDAAISLYVIEHLVWPHRLIDEMYRLVRPGGLIGMLFPPFRIRHSIKSFDYGLSAQPFKDKLKSGLLLDAALHLYQHRIAYLLYLKKNFPRRCVEHQFLINLKPICLQSGAWFPDADAVYLADSAEIVMRLYGKGAVLIEEWPKQGYVLMRKRDSGS
jgi:ubiquinone/menaquinone biosynthesis C-methylase UbiE